MFISSEVNLFNLLLGSTNHLQISYTNHSLLTNIQLIGMIKYNRYLLRTYILLGIKAKDAEISQSQKTGKLKYFQYCILSI